MPGSSRQTSPLLSPSHSKNLNNSQSNVVSFPLSVEAQAQVSLNGSVPKQNGAFRGTGTGLLGKDTWIPLAYSKPSSSSSVSPSLKLCSSQSVTGIPKTSLRRRETWALLSTMSMR